MGNVKLSVLAETLQASEIVRLGGNSMTVLASKMLAKLEFDAAISKPRDCWLAAI